MDVQTIVGIGFAVTRGRQPNSFDVRTWVRTHPGSAIEAATYEGLSFAEAMSVIEQEFDLQKPGYQMLDGTFQAPLWSD